MGLKVKRGELSIRDTFIEELKRVFRDENYEIFEEIITKDLTGKAIKISDIVILEKGKFKEIEEEDEVFLILELDAVKTIVETKNPSKYASDGIIQLFEYSDILNVQNGYTTNFSDVLFYYQDEKPLFIPTKFSGKLRTRCEKISKHILQNLKNPPKKEELEKISEESLIETLQIINEELKLYIKNIEIDKIQESIGIFEISSDTEVIKEITNDDIKNAASFLLLNQLLFYGILSEKLGLVSFIEKVQSLNDLAKIFDFIYHIDYRAVYGFDILQYLDDKCINIINSILLIFRKFNFHQFEKDILGKIFHGIIPLNLRKRIAAYYTSNYAGELLARLSVYNKDDKIIDPACGSGTLLVSSLQVKKELLDKKRISKSHQELLEDIFGVDISIFASHLSVINLSIHDLSSITNKVYVFIDDAFNLLPSKRKTVLFSYNPKEIATKDGIQEAEEMEIPLFNVVISNPPFTRVERLTDNKKEFLQKQRYMKDYMVGQAGLHIGFIIHSYNLLEDDGHLAMVLPSATFSSNYSDKIESFILKNFTIKFFIISDIEITFSEGSNFKEILLICKKEKIENWSVKFINLKKKLIDYNLKILSDLIINSTNDFENDNLKIRFISKNELENIRNWIKFTREGLEAIVKKIYISKKLCKQGKQIIFHEGYHLDAPYFFRIPNTVWNLIRDEETYIEIQNEVGEILNIPKTYLVKSLGKPGLHTTIKPQMSSYILSIINSPKTRRIPDSDLKKYIEWGKSYSKKTMSPKKKEQKTVLDLYKIKKYHRNNRPWYTYGHYILSHKELSGVTGQIGGKIALIEKFGIKTRPNIAYYSKKKLTGSNSYFFGEITFREVNPEILGSWFCSSFYLLLYLYNRREIVGAYGRIKIKDFEKFKCIDPTKLTKSQKKEIIKAFRDYQNNFPEEIDIISQIFQRNDYLRELDISILSSLELNLGNKNLDQFLEDIYNVIIEELEKLK